MWAKTFPFVPDGVGLPSSMQGLVTSWFYLPSDCN